MREWPTAWSGRESTARVLESGSHPPFDERPQGALLLVDVVSGRQRTVMRGFVRELRIAPDRRHIACFRQVDVVGLKRAGRSSTRGTRYIDWRS